MTYVNHIAVIALAVFLRVSLPTAGEGRNADATKVNMNVLVGASVVLLLLRIIFDLARP